MFLSEIGLTSLYRLIINVISNNITVCMMSGLKMGEVGVSYLKLPPNCPKCTEEGMQTSVKSKFSRNVYRILSEYVICVNGQ